MTAYECRLDDAAFAPCAADGVNYADLGGGTHRFEVRARDAAGRVDPAPAARDWTVDLLAPSTTFAGAPDASTPATDAAFSFTAADAGGSEVAGFECRLDGAPFAACSSPVALAGLAPGPHTFAVRATDAVGNVEGTPASHSWNIAAIETPVAEEPVSQQPVSQQPVNQAPVTQEPASPAPAAQTPATKPTAAQLTLGVSRRLVFRPGARVTCRMTTGALDTCVVVVRVRGKIVAKGRASVKGARASLGVRLRLTATGRRVLRRGVVATVHARAHAGGAWHDRTIRQRAIARPV